MTMPGGQAAASSLAMSPQSTLVFGGGFIGGTTAASLKQAGHAVSVVTRAPPPQEFPPEQWLFGEVGDNVCEARLQGHDAVICASGSMMPASKVASVAMALQDQVIPVVALAEQAAAAGVRTFVFISSGGTVYGRAGSLPSRECDPTAPINTYGMVKVQTELALLEVGRSTGMSVVVLRVSNPYGPGQSGRRRLGFIAAAVEAVTSGATLSIWGDGTNTRDFVFIGDVAEAIRLAAGWRGESQVLNIGSGQEVSLLEVCRHVEEISGRTLHVEFEAGRPVDVPRSVLDIAKARQVLGWAPGTLLDDGIARTLGSK